MKETGDSLKSMAAAESLQHDDAFIFIYSRFCGTCHVARGFLDKIENTHGIDIFYEMNGSLHPEFLQENKIESVPCLLIIKTV